MEEIKLSDADLEMLLIVDTNLKAAEMSLKEIDAVREGVVLSLTKAIGGKELVNALIVQRYKLDGEFKIDLETGVITRAEKQGAC